MKAFHSMVALLLLLPLRGNGQHCAAEAFRESYALEYPELKARRQAIEEATNRWMEDHAGGLQVRESLVIPVVVHVVYQTAPQNISLEQVQSQLTVLNDDYRALNSNLDIVPSIFTNLVADLGIEFCLATRDPEGNPTTGVTRTQTPLNDIGLSSKVHYAAQGGADAWDPAHYLNIWVADMGENVLGRASFPGGSPPEEDGVVVDPRYFGTTGLAAAYAPYHLGRTTVHEVGHYLNLLHPWGSETPSCDGDDLVLDTPLTSEDYLDQCPSSLQASCGSLDMYTNFMYYTNDACMAQFTPGQKLRVWACLNGPRSGLQESLGCDPVGTIPAPGLSSEFRVFPNPGSEEVTFEYRSDTPGSCLVRILDGLGRLVREFEIPSGQAIPWAVPSTLQSGVYTIQAGAGRKWVVQKWVLAR